MTLGLGMGMGPKCLIVGRWRGNSVYLIAWMGNNLGTGGVIFLKNGRVLSFDLILQCNCFFLFFFWRMKGGALIVNAKV